MEVGFLRLPVLPIVARGVPITGKIDSTVAFEYILDA